MSTSSAISVTGLTKRYGERLALDHATFDVPIGSVCGFLGRASFLSFLTKRALSGWIHSSRPRRSIHHMVRRTRLSIAT